MRYYIDAYNLLFRQFIDDDNFEFHREELIDSFLHALDKLTLNIVLVFDAHQVNDFTRTHIQKLEIVYTDLNETADEYIIKTLEHSSQIKQDCVVSSDHKLTRIVRSMGAKSQTVEDFISWIQKKLQKSNSSGLPEKNDKKQNKRPSNTPNKNKNSSTDSLITNEFFDLLPPINAECSSTEMFQYYLDSFEKKLRDKENNSHPSFDDKSKNSST